jgi:hypothetical protein
MKKLSLLTFPWLSMVSIVLAYGLLGWQLSSLSVIWLLESWVATIVIVFLLIWRGGLVTRWFRVGPTVLVSILFASFTIVFAIAFTDLFGLALVLLLSIFWGRLELQSRGLHQRLILACLCFMSGSGLTVGWILGQSPQMIEGILSRLHH